MKTQSCELADLLVLHSHCTADRKIFYRGTLIQTKMYSERSVVPDDPQFWLYDNWPQFSIRAPDFDPRLRDFEAHPRSGLYALVANHAWRVMPPRNPLSPYCRASLDFSTFLVQMLYDMDPAQPYRKSLHGRQVYHDSSKDWSPTVWEILSITANMALKHMGRKNGLYNSVLPTRSSGHVLSLLTSGRLFALLPNQQKFYSIPPTSKEEPDDSGPGGVSVLCIETAVRGE
jgi:hypothetical protein